MSLTPKFSLARDEQVEHSPTKGYVTFSCRQCRGSHPVCRPTDRRWPVGRCNRCSDKNYECLESFTRKENNNSKQNGIPWETYLRSPCHRERLHNFDGRGYFCQIYALPMSFQPRKPYIVQASNLDPRPEENLKPLCSQYFSLLLNISWRFFGTPASAPEDVNVVCDYGECIASESYYLFAVLQERQLCIRLHEERQKFSRSLPWARRLGEEQAFAHATKSFLSMLISHRDETWKNKTVEEYVRHRDSQLLRGLRWKDLIDSVGSQEVLLMDYPRLGNPNLIAVNEVIKNGTDPEFEACKEALLFPELQLKNAMARLDNLLSLIQQLKDTGEQSKQRTAFAQEIHRRIGEAFGLPHIVQTVDPQGVAELKVEDDSDGDDDVKVIGEDDENNSSKAFQYVVAEENPPIGNCGRENDDFI